MADIKQQLQAYLDAATTWLVDYQRTATAYFKGCGQWELAAWGGNGLGLVLIVVGIILL